MENMDFFVFQTIAYKNVNIIAQSIGTHIDKINHTILPTEICLCESYLLNSPNLNGGILMDLNCQKWQNIISCDFRLSLTRLYQQVNNWK